MKNMLKEPYDCWCNERYLEHDRPMDLDASKYLLITLKQVLAKHGIIMMPMFGTLLGAIRENGFIKNDTDIDVAVYSDDIPKIFALRDEFETFNIHLHCYVLPWIFTFEYKGMTCDFYPLYPSAWPWTNHYYLLLERYINKKWFAETEDYKLYGETFKIPANPEKFLAYLYGKSWRIPQSKKSQIESKLFFWRYAHRYLQKCIRRINRLFRKK